MVPGQALENELLPVAASERRVAVNRDRLVVHFQPLDGGNGLGLALGRGAHAVRTRRGAYRVRG